MSDDVVSHYLKEKYYQGSHWYWLIGHILQHRSKVLWIMGLTIIAIGLQTYLPILLGLAIDTAIPRGNTTEVTQIALIIIGLGIMRAIISYISSIQNEQVAQNVEMQVRVEFFDNLSRKNMEFFNKARVGDLMSQATQDTLNLTFAISPGIRSIVSAVFGLLATVFFMFSLSFSLTLVFLVIVPFYVYYLFTYAKKLQPVSLERQERLAGINASLQENLTGIRVVRTFSGQQKEKEVFARDVRDYEEILIKRGSISAYFVPTLLLGLVTSLIFLAGVYLFELTQSGSYFLNLGTFTLEITAISVGDLIAFITLTGLLLFPTNILRFLLDITMLGFAGSKRIFATLTTVSTLENGKGIELENVQGSIQFQSVRFAYETQEGEQRALDDFSLTISPGETVVILGPTGSGKSTVGRLLQRLYDINQGGRILIDGVNIKELELNHLRQIVGVIEQDVFLFSTSLRNNIAYGMTDVGENEIEAAAQAAQAHEFILQFKDGYQTIVGEKGVTLSGGQRQRIAMARTFITDPKILIMDDSTSAVDAETEAKIQEAMNKLLQGRTTIIITHRLSTLKKADKIVFMRKGRIERVGTHDDLISSFKPYRQIFETYMKLPAIKEDDIL